MTHEEMDCEGDLTLDESQINDKDETEKENTHLVRLHHVNFFDFRPRPINCMAFDPLSKKMAIARWVDLNKYLEYYSIIVKLLTICNHQLIHFLSILKIILKGLTVMRRLLKSGTQLTIGTASRHSPPAAQLRQWFGTILGSSVLDSQEISLSLILGVAK